MSNTITPTVFCRTLNVRGLEIFYREACPRDSPAVLLLHGSPSSSHMFRNLCGVTDPELLDAVARRLDTGMVWINQHLNLHPNIPFSGHKNSAIGIEFGEDGLKEFCNVQVIANRR